jgi:hypothetical protein
MENEDIPLEALIGATLHVSPFVYGRLEKIQAERKNATEGVLGGLTGKLMGMPVCVSRFLKGMEICVVSKDDEVVNDVFTVERAKAWLKEHDNGLRTPFP